ncbi:MAG: hypothetical protein K0S39_6071 [Paenibacillus sp.]|jgi:DNA primase|nr:hypothetical protein [Paenibacillus sp.]
MSKKEILSILDALFIDPKELIEELLFEYQHSLNYELNPNAFDCANDTGNWVMCCCPIHAESRASFGISKEAPYKTNCFYCGPLGTIDQVIEHAFDLAPGEGIKKLLFSLVQEERRAPLNLDELIENGRNFFTVPSMDEAVVQSFLSKSGREWQWDQSMNYMRSRGFTERCLKTYEIGVDTEANCIVFPQRTREGKIRFVQKRKIGEHYIGAKFVNEGQAIKKDILFGLHHINKLRFSPHRIRRIRLVESPTDAMSNYEVGVPAVSINGKILFHYQVKELLWAGIEIVDLMLDNDEAGRNGSKAAAKKLEHAGIIVNQVLYPHPLHKDANALYQAGLLHLCQTVNWSLIHGLA